VTSAVLPKQLPVTDRSSAPWPARTCRTRSAASLAAWRNSSRNPSGLLGDLQHQPEPLLDRRGDTGRHLRVTYLDTTGGFGVLARDALIADAVTRIAADPRTTDDDGHHLDARHALTYVRNVLDELAEGSQTAR
jgi:hypothetical protein